MRTYRSKFAVVVLFLCVSSETYLSQAVWGQARARKQDDATLRLNVRRVPVDIVVLDSNGNPVRGLKKDDFVVKENGEPQRALSFEWTDGSKPARPLPKVPPLPVNTFVNVPAQPDRGALYVLYYDMVNTSQVDQMSFRNMLLDFIDHAPPGVRIALFVNAKKLWLLQGFTSDHALLREAVLHKGNGPHIPQVFIYGEVFGRGDAGGALSNLNFIAQYLEGIPGRKNLLWLADGFPIPVAPSVFAGPHGTATNPSGGPQLMDLSVLMKGIVSHTYTELMRSQVALYPVRLTGVDADLAYQDIMNLIAEATGGRAYFSNNRVDQLLDRAVHHGESYYTLSYAPTNAKFDGSERAIRIQLKHPGKYTLAYRHVYYAVPDEINGKSDADPLQERFVKAKLADILFANIEHGAPMLHDILFTAHLSTKGGPHVATAEQMSDLEQSPQYFVTRKKHPNKAIAPANLQKYVIDYGVIDAILRNRSAATVHAETLEFAAAAYDEEGRLLNSMLNEGVTPPDQAQKKNAALHAIQELEVPAGAAFLRMAVRDKATNRTGTLEVKLPLKDNGQAGPATSEQMAKATMH